MKLVPINPTTGCNNSITTEYTGQCYYSTHLILFKFILLQVMTAEDTLTALRIFFCISFCTYLVFVPLDVIKHGAVS